MNAFLTELGKHLAGRVAAVLALPAAVFVAVAVVAVILGHTHALDIALLRTHVLTVSTGPDFAWVAAGFLAASAAAGLVVNALGKAVIATWAATGSGLGKPFAALRHRRWRRAGARADAAIKTLLAGGFGGAAADGQDDREAAEREGRAVKAARAKARRAVLRRDAIAEIEPACPTWAGDRLRAVAERVRRGTGLDLPTTWPRLWLVLPDSVRTELTAVQDRCATAARTPIWALGYLIVGAYWWPALVPGLWLLLVSRHRIRRAIGMYADLVEAAVDLHSRDLAEALGLACNGVLTPKVGEQVTEVLRKQGRPEMTPA